MKVNGWSNYQTFLVSLWYGEWFANMKKEEITADNFNNIVIESLVMEGHLPENGFAADIMLEAIKQVNWQELADRYTDVFN